MSNCNGKAFATLEEINDPETPTLPHALGQEKSVLSTFMQEPHRLGDTQGITLESFYLKAHSILFESVMEIAAEGDAVELVTLVQRLIDAGQLASVGGAAALTEIYSYAPTHQNFDQHAKTLHEKHAERLAILEGKALQELDLAQADKLRKQREELATGKTSDIIAQRSFDVHNPPADPPPMVKLGEHGIFSAGNLSAIIADRKAGKSSALSGIMAAFFAKRYSQADCLGFTAENPEERAVIHFDSEQSPADHHRQIVRALRRAELTEPPQWFSSYSLTGLALAERIRFVDDVCKIKLALHGGIQVVMIDGIADLCRDPNDQAESFDIVEKWHNFSVKESCVVLAILHLNPGTEKSRGHLGSQLERKAQTPLLIKKDSNGISTMFATHARSCHIPENEGFSFQWSDDAQMHVSISRADRTKAKDSLKRNRAADEAHALLVASSPKTYSELVRAIEERFAVSPRTAKNRVKEWQEMAIITKYENGTFALSE